MTHSNGICSVFVHKNMLNRHKSWRSNVHMRTAQRARPLLRYCWQPLMHPCTHHAHNQQPTLAQLGACAYCTAQQDHGRDQSTPARLGCVPHNVPVRHRRKRVRTAPLRKAGATNPMATNRGLQKARQTTHTQHPPDKKTSPAKNTIKTPAGNIFDMR